VERARALVGIELVRVHGPDEELALVLERLGSLGRDLGSEIVDGGSEPSGHLRVSRHRSAATR
jgi:hypothetical protein